MRWRHKSVPSSRQDSAGRKICDRTVKRSRAQRTRHFDVVPVVHPTIRPISRVGIPSAVASTICARMRIRTSDLVERTNTSSSARSSDVSTIAVARGTDLIPPLNHDSTFSDSGYWTNLDTFSRERPADVLMPGPTSMIKAVEEGIPFIAEMSTGCSCGTWWLAVRHAVSDEAQDH
jgi:hypothetical protein